MAMRTLLSSVAAGLLLMALGGRCDDVGNGGFAVVAYLPEYRYEGANWEEIAARTSHIILFSLEINGGTGDITAKDRIPRDILMDEAREAAKRHGTKLLICFGGNGRSQGFSGMVAHPGRRKRFVKSLVQLIDDYKLDGVDYNWEYPGYIMGRGYRSEKEIRLEYEAFGKLVAETRAAFDSALRPLSLTLAYYPDGRQEKLLAQVSKAVDHVDYFHAMAYDQGGKHSTMELFERSIENGKKHFPPHKLTVGVPFYGRSLTTGEAISFEDIVKKAAVDSDESRNQADGFWFNGRQLIARKTTKGIEQNIGGVMIWEVAQDCRIAPVNHIDGSGHVQTCPRGEKSSLLGAIDKVVVEAKRKMNTIHHHQQEL